MTNALQQGELRVVLSLGSNLGDRAGEIRAAVTEIADTPDVRLLGVSHLVESAALKVHGTDERAPRYLNAVVIVATSLEPHALLHQLARIENAHGRVRDERWGDRTLDIDIVDYDGRVLHDDRLTLPHPRAHERAFVLAPWLQLDPTAQLVQHGSVADLLTVVSDVVQPWPNGASS
ncbi:2-amino-4-hydroxy-6-hydroxymethyldihydropteridine diphosphokinase [Rathayibacter sp. YIM 133350]|uniref:2-amino-4-hydroxy-6- hydroxymethyldihydropteridine diphosphokinase n=1 Tax=Rathayibacter sp. YIM 133350 TaxID=3131992 RepID=UPI00307D264E